MKKPKISESLVRRSALLALRTAFIRVHPDLKIDHNGYTSDFRETLLTKAIPQVFGADLSTDDGNEIQMKFRAIHLYIIPPDLKGQDCRGFIVVAYCKGWLAINFGKLINLMNSSKTFAKILGA